MDNKRSDPQRDAPVIEKTGVSPADRDADGRNPSPSKRQPDRARSDDDRIDEASEESFPASDPPAQP